VLCPPWARRRRVLCVENSSAFPKRGADAEDDETDHQHDADERCAGCVVGLADVDAGGANRQADCDEADRECQFLGGKTSRVFPSWVFDEPIMRLKREALVNPP